MAKEVKKTLRERLTPGKMSGWLPAVAAFLCLSMFAIAALVLFQVGSDPQSGPAPLPTAVSAQGFGGLRRVLEADGHTTVINRFEDMTGKGAGPVERGDLEIITLDNSYSLITGGYDALDDSSEASDGEESSAADASEAATPPAVGDPDIVRRLQQGIGAVPNPKRVNHILYNPLGKAVLIVVPKWESAVYPRNRRWGQGPRLIDAAEIQQMLTILSPVALTETEYDDDSNIVPPQPVSGKSIHVGHVETLTYDVVDYQIQRATRPAAAKVQQPNPNKDPIIEMQNRADPDEAVSADIILSPVAGQSPFASALKAGKIAGLQSITAPNLVPVLVTPDGRPVLSRLIVTEGRPQTKVPVYLLSDPDLLNNQILSEPQKVATALALMDGVTPGQQPKSRIVFNMTFNGLSFDRDLLYALSRPPFLGVSLALLILGVALMWAAFARFGPAELAAAGPPLGRGVRTLADNAARLMAVAVKETKLGPAYAILVRDTVIRGRGHRMADGQHNSDDLAEHIGKTHGATDSYLDLRDRAARVVTVHQLIDVTRKLHAWKTEIERAHI